MVYIALGAVLIAVCSWISIPSPVPFTLQTFAIFLVLGVLGGRRGTVSVIIYLLLGIVGMPVFSGFKGGFGVILGPTGGYIVGFLLSAIIYWVLTAAVSKRGPGLRRGMRVIGCAAGLLVCYIFGTGWFYETYLHSTGPVSVWTVLGWCVFPFIIPDIIKIALALVLSQRIRRRAHIQD